MYRNKMPYKRGFHPAKVIFFLFVFVGFTLLLGGVVMFLWNAILPEVVGAKPLTWLQAIGLLVLSRILFGGFRLGSFANRKVAGKRRYWKEKWMNMSEEERVAMKQKWRKRCGPSSKGKEENSDLID